MSRLTPDSARALMHEWVPSPSLRHHMECVAACMGAYADVLAPEQRDRWVVCGLLHDFDYERHPSREEHPYRGVAHLRDGDHVDDETIQAILGHAEYTGTPRTTPMAKVLFAVDELAGFVVACAKVRPDGFASLAPKSVRKRLKEKSFAAAVSRADIAQGLAELLPELRAACVETGTDDAAAADAHYQRCIDAIAKVK